MTIQKYIAAELLDGEKSVFGPDLILCMCIPPQPLYRVAQWRGEFVSSKLVALSADTLKMKTIAGEIAEILLTRCGGEMMAGGTGRFSGEFEGVGTPPKELYDPPAQLKHEPAKVRLIMQRHKVDQPVEEFDTLKDALNSAYWAVESDEAGPKLLTVPSTLIGHSPAKFDSKQIYAMFELLGFEKP